MAIEEYLSKTYRERFAKLFAKKGLAEVVFRGEKPVYYTLFLGEVEPFLDDDGKEVILKKKELEEIYLGLCRYSLYVYEEERKQGYFTLIGGHRVGISGKVLMEEGRVKEIVAISSIHLRFAKEIKGLSRDFLPYLYINRRPVNTMIFSRPGCGKTTLLRDLIRFISNGNSEGGARNVVVIDERSEIGGAYQGIAQLDLGDCTDLLEGCEKKAGVMMAIRSLSPQVLAVDEVGNRQEQEAILKASFCGVGILLTAHGNSLEDLKQRFELEHFLESANLKRMIGLRREEKGMLYTLYDEKERILFQKEVI